MTGAKGGVGARLKRKFVIMIRSHCINHHLALACGDANEQVKYIQVVEVALRQVWKWLEDSKHSATFVKVCKATQQINLVSGRKLSKKLAVNVQKACRTRWLSTGNSVASVCHNLVALLQTFSLFKDQNATAAGLLSWMNSTKSVAHCFC